MELVIMKDKQAVTSSLQVARNFDKNHRDVLESVRNLTAENPATRIMFFETTYKNSRGQEYPEYLMNRDGFTLLAMGFTGKKALEFKLKYIDAFNQMENHIKENQLKIPQSPMEILKLVFDVQRETSEMVEDVDNRVTELEENVVLSAGDYSYISRRINQRVSEVAKSFGKLTQKQRGELYRDINSGVNQITGVGTRTQLRQKHYDTVMEFIIDWEPSTATKTIVRQMALDLGGD